MLLALSAAWAAERGGGRASSPRQANSHQLEANKADLQRVQSRIAAVTETMTADQGQRNALQADVETAERGLQQTQAHLHQLNQQLAAQQRAAADIEAQRTRVQGQEVAQRRTLAREIRAAFVMAQGGAASVMLASEDPTRIGRVFGYTGYLERERAHIIATLQADVAEQDALAARSRAEQAHLVALGAATQSALGQLRDQRAQRATAVARMQEKIAGESQELKTLQASELQTKQLIERLQRALADVPITRGPQGPFPRMRGRLVWPLHGRLLAHYGEPKAEGRLQWKGIWISAPEGAPVHAVARGRVAYVGWLSRYGQIVVLQHDDGYFSLYGHAASVTCSAGQVVNAGDTLATAGSTGGYSEPGVYLEIRHGTETIDPAAWLGQQG
jgi:septal ring factor EnvC (AmiA/AmiB activator)